MPIRLPEEPRPKTRSLSEVGLIDSIDWLAVWALSVGACAVVVAAAVDFVAQDPTGAGLILASAAALMAAVSWGARRH